MTFWLKYVIRLKSCSGSRFMLLYLKTLFGAVCSEVSAKFEFFFCFKLIFLMFLERFDVVIVKIKKYYCEAFPSKKHFEKQPQSYF
jgi:hypothetical protein